MSKQKALTLVLAILLSVGHTGAVLAEEAAAPVETVLQQMEFFIESTPAITPAPVASETAPVNAGEPEAPTGETPTEVPMTSDVPAESNPSNPPAETETPAPTDEVTEYPAADATEAPPQATEAPTEAPAEAQPVTRGVSIAMDIPDQLQMGDTVTLTATLYGYDDVNVALQWQYTRDGEEWFNAQDEGATTLTYAFTVNDETAGTAWRLAVTLL